MNSALFVVIIVLGLIMGYVFTVVVCAHIGGALNKISQEKKKEEEYSRVQTTTQHPTAPSLAQLTRDTTQTVPNTTSQGGGVTEVATLSSAARGGEALASVTL